MSDKDDTDLFEEKDAPKEDLLQGEDKPKEETPSGGDDYSALLSSIVGDDGKPKYNSIEEALKGAANAQEYIKTLKNDMKSLEEKADAASKLDEIYKAIEESKGSGKGDEEASTLKPEDVKGIVQSLLEETKSTETRQANINNVIGHFKSKYGKDASEKLYGKAEDLGFGKSEINRMIAQNPKAVLKILGEDKVEKKGDIMSQPGFNPNNLTGGDDNKPKVSVMDMHSSKDLTEAWKDVGKRVRKELGIQ